MAQMSNLEDKSDIHGHIATLVQYASQCPHITEMGVRGLNSTNVFLETKPKTLISYDWDKPPFEVDREALRLAQSKANDLKVAFNFIVADTISIQIESTDLLYIDTWHTYEQLLLELLLHSSLTAKYIIAHDTNEAIFPGMTCAIEDFLNLNSQWQMELMLVDLPGLTVLERASDKAVFWGDFRETDLRKEIEKQTSLYYRQCVERLGSTSHDWLYYQEQQVMRFKDSNRWPKTNSLR